MNNDPDQVHIWADNCTESIPQALGSLWDVSQTPKPSQKHCKSHVRPKTKNNLLHPWGPRSFWLSDRSYVGGSSAPAWRAIVSSTRRWRLNSWGGSHIGRVRACVHVCVGSDTRARGRRHARGARIAAQGLGRDKCAATHPPMRRSRSRWKRWRAARPCMQREGARKGTTDRYGHSTCVIWAAKAAARPRRMALYGRPSHSPPQDILT